VGCRIELFVRGIHRGIGMTGGLSINALRRESKAEISAHFIAELRRRHAEARALGVGYGREELERGGSYRVYADPRDLLRHLDEVGVRR
jgi:hypothetical protein